MKKLIFLITFYLTFSGVGFSQDYNTSGKSRAQLKAMVAELVAEKDVEKEDSILVVLNDSTSAVVPLDSINSWIEGMDSTLAKINTVGDVIKNSPDLIRYYIKIKDGIAFVIKNNPLPNTKEGVMTWIDTLQVLLPQIIGLLTFLLTAVFRILKRSPEGVKTIGGKLLGWIRTRYFVPVAGFALSVIGFAFFSEGAWGVGEFVIYTITSIVMAFGIDNIIKLITGFFDKKDKVEKEETS